MTDGDNKKGFAGLDGLVSDVDNGVKDAERTGQRQSSAQAQSSSTSTRPQSQPKPAPKQQSRRPAPAPPVDSGSGRKNAWLWVLGGFVLFLVWAANQDGGSGRTTSPSSTSYSPPNTSRPQSSPTLPTLTKPPVGTNHVHSFAEIRYCLAEEIRLEALEPRITTNSQNDAFNSLVFDYNSRCGSYRYRQGALASARRAIEPYRSTIAANSWTGLSLSSSAQQQPSSPPVQRSQLTMDIQSALTELGYQPGTADGIFGPRTKSAIQAFQRDVGVSQDGVASRQLLDQIKKEATRSKNQRSSNQAPATSRPSSASSPVAAPSPASASFTRGSHQNDVLRLQGTPSDIDTYSIYEIWWYGSSTVKLDKRSKRVLEWDNNGNLKVRLLPGRQTTTSRSFTRGSHQDDVLRLQGTPSDIDGFSSYEIWWYGSSTVKLDKSTKRVIEWDDNGNLKAEMKPGGQTTTARAFTRGSHQDDVLRLQGTPSDIDNYSSYEIWWYGSSTVKLDRGTKRVIEWDNNGNLRVHL